MADRYWVGGTASWDGTAGTKWSATSGGAGGAAIPTSADDVFFNAASGAGTVTIATGNTGAKSINCTGFTGTLTGTAAITVSGSITLVAGMTHTFTGSITFNAAGTITSAGKTLASTVSISPTGGTLGLADALNITSTLTYTLGNFASNNFNITVGGSFNATTPTFRNLNLGSSTITCGGGVSFASGNLTFNAGTSSFVLTGAGVTFAGGGLTFNDISFTTTTAGTLSVTGSNVFNNFSVAAPSAVGVMNVTFGDRQTINGTLSTTGTAGNRRVWFRSTTYGISQVLVVNSAASLTDADFRDIIVIGTAAPISGTRIGDLRGNSGVTFSAPKTVYWNLGGTSASLIDNAWAASSGGTPSTDNFPLAQDTAVFDNTSAVPSGTITTNVAIPYIGTINMGGRTSAIRLQTAAATFAIYGNFICGSGTVINDTGILTFSGRNTQTITSAGKTFSGSITIDTFGGSVELADALSIASTSALQVVNGTFDSKGYNITTNSGAFSATGSNPKTINFTSSTVTIGGNFTLSTLNTTYTTFNASGSSIFLTGGLATLTAGGAQFNNLTFSNTTVQGNFINTITGGVNTFTNLTFTAPASGGLKLIVLGANQIVTGALTTAGASAIRRVFIRSDTPGTQRTITAGSITANDCDFRDIIIAGSAAGGSPTRAGNCGNNSGVTFPTAKTVYWNLTGAQNIDANGWATSSGGTPAIDNFPLAQDTAIINNSSSGTSIGIAANFNMGTIDASARTTAFTLGLTQTSVTLSMYGNLLFGTGITTTSVAGQLIFANTATSTITSNGVVINHSIEISGPGTVQLADALTIATSRALFLNRGKFDAVSFNVTVGTFSSTGSTIVRELVMGSGLWSLTGTGTVWGIDSGNLTFNPQTANIILTDTSTTARTFNAGSLSYNKLTIGGSTGISTTTITGNNTFTELASTKTVAHTIALGTQAQTIGKWTVTGTAGNVVTLTGTVTTNILAGAATSGIDYLAMGSIGFAASSPGEFYAGVNSTGTAAAPVFRTSPPAARTLYWVGGTGNWSDTARWSTSSGGGGGVAVPTSLDDVVFNSLSNATAYTATLNVVARCNQLTIAGPASGNLTLASSATTNRLIVHGNTSFPATGFTRTFTSPIVLAGSTTGKTFTSNGVVFAGPGSDGGAMIVSGVGSSWSMSDAINLGTVDGLILLYGTFSTNNFNLTGGTLIASAGGSTGGAKTLNLGSSTVTLNGGSFSFPIQFGTNATIKNLFAFNAGSSQITISTAGTGTFNGNGLTFNNVSMTTASSFMTLNNSNIFNNLTLGPSAASGLLSLSLGGNNTVNNTLTLTAGSTILRRMFVRSDVLGTTRTITCAAFAATSDIDFRDITIAGAAAPISGTRFGDCKGNSGITFPSPKTVYWNLVAGGFLDATAWATSSGGTPDINNFPLAQDTAIIENTGLNSAATITASTGYNIGTINMSTRTTAMTFTSSGPYTIYGNLTYGSGTTIAGIGAVTFSGRTTQTLTTAGKSFTMPINISSPGGSVTLQDSLTFVTDGLTVLSLVTGTFDTNSYNVTSTGSSSQISTSGNLLKTFMLGSETWTFQASGSAWNAGTSNTTISGTRTGTFNFTSASAKQFTGGGLDYGNITINNGGAGALTISGNNRLGDLTATRTATSAATISLGTTIQSLAQFSGSGQAGRLLTVTGSSAISPATLIFTGSGIATTSAVDYLTLIGVRAYPTTDTWYAGDNSITATSTGTLGWIYASAVVPTAVTSGNFLMFAMP